MKVISLCKTIWICGTVMAVACGVDGPQQREAAGEVGGRRIDVTEYGAKGDGRADDSRAIQMALDSASMGDTVYVPKGTYLVRSLRLMPNVHLVADGVLKQPREFSSRFSIEKQHSDAP